MPGDSVQFLFLEEVIEIHRILLDRIGGPQGLRDVGLLDSALYRPRTGYYKSLDKMAAAMFELLIKNLPFVAGNKRVAFFATNVFLRLNGYKFDVEPKSAYQFLVDLLEKNQCIIEQLHPWVRKSIKTLC